jgi:hypothetical protein
LSEHIRTLKRDINDLIQDEVAAICWGIAGALFVLFSAMNYFTHIGLLMNTSDSF